MGNFESLETIQFVPGWVDFPLLNGMKMDIQTSLKGVDLSFDQCFEIAPTVDVEEVHIPYLHLNQLLANKKAVGRPKDLNDADELEKIKKLLDDSKAS